MVGSAADTSRAARQIAVAVRGIEPLAGASKARRWRARQLCLLALLLTIVIVTLLPLATAAAASADSPRRPLKVLPQRRLQAWRSNIPAEEAEPTLDEVDSVLFSRPPYSQQVMSLSVYYTMTAIYVLFAILILVGANLDAAERRDRVHRGIVPQEESADCKLLCCRVSLPQENVPCEITEQYFLDGRLLALRRAEDIDSRKKRMGFLGYMIRYSSDFAEILLREHLALSFFAKAIPTFTRVKRAILIVVQVHVCMLMGAMLYNIREHNAPNGRYEIFSCSADDTNPCFATVPAAVLATLAACPAFRFSMYRQMRLTCFVSQSHPSTSQFPLGMRKFASLLPKTLAESVLCMRNAYDGHRTRVTQSRSLPHRIVHILWQTTQSSIKDLRFYSTLTSWFILAVLLGFVLMALAYVLSFAVYLEEAVVYHWLIWTFVMLAMWTFVCEPLLLLWTEVLWCAIIATVAQKWGYGSHALAATTKYKGLVKEVDQVVISRLRSEASVRVQKWWVSVLNMNQEIHQQTQAANRAAAAMKIQAAQKKKNKRKTDEKERKWCMRVDVNSCGDLDEVFGEELSPFIRLKCDTGNDKVNETKVHWGAGTQADFYETFFVDISESDSMTVSAWTKGIDFESFIGKATIDFEDLKSKEEKDAKPQGHKMRLELAKSQNAASSKKSGPSGGFLNLRVVFLDPVKDECGIEGQVDWMSPKNRMKFAMKKMGGHLKIGKILGAMNKTAASTPEVRVPSAQVNLSIWHADNSELKAKSAGIGYRKSKDLRDPVEPPQAVLWGSKITGEDEGDGWLRVDQNRQILYVPMELKGIRVLQKYEAGASASAPNSAASSSGAGAGGSAAPRPPKMPRPGASTPQAASEAPMSQPAMPPPGAGVGGFSTPTAASGVATPVRSTQEQARAGSPLSLNPISVGGQSGGDRYFPGAVPEGDNSMEQP